MQMRDVFEGKGVDDPVEAARRTVRTALRKRFYDTVSVATAPDGHAILLDGKQVRTPANRPLAAPTSILAQALADEWHAQDGVIDPAKMPLNRLANSIVDGVGDHVDAVKAEVEKYLGSDLLCYRASAPSALLDRQAKFWDPVLAWARDTLGAQFWLAEGVMYVAQPKPALAAAGAAIPRDPWRLGAVHTVTTVTGSALLALALARGAISVDDAWTAAHVDEDWNMEQWGRDELAMQRRAFRRAEFQAAAMVLGSL
jgi:chaperone required for assembly of F1-ATPase